DLHDHDGRDPHIWLSPPLVKIQARTILNALQEIDPVHRGVYEANFREFASKIDALDADLKKVFSGKQGLQFLVFHPSWGYFAETYGLQQVSIEIEGKEPKPARLKELIEHARRKNIWPRPSRAGWSWPTPWPRIGWPICVMSRRSSRRR
ncbi:MAG: zinc ABC transporter substrate-binding protein, partial [Deltaproteobacteria bacterium]|nr:zinc ABC transporter substrate-binding protein [Deltaproteobacteria bacterium]